MTPPAQGPGAPASALELKRHLGMFDTAMIVVGGMIGSGIFMSPYVAARYLDNSALIVAAWILGGILAVCGAASYAELAARRPSVGGQYTYLRDAFHPSLAFLYGWALLSISQSGGMAAVALTAARHLNNVLGASVPESVFAVSILAAVTAVNCMNARTWTFVQTSLTILKSALLVTVAVGGILWFRGNSAALSVAGKHSSVIDFGSALVPIMFAYGGWQTSCFIAGEVRRPQHVLPRALLLGVSSVTALYVLINYALLRAFGPAELAATSTPAAALAQRAWGLNGGIVIAIGVSIAAIGFLNQCALTVPRVYYAMSKDGLFPGALTKLSRRSGMPTRAIVLQSSLAAVYCLVGGFEQILTWMVAVDFLFYGLAACSLFVFRRRESIMSVEVFSGHPFTTALFAASCGFIVVASIASAPLNNGLGIALVILGVPVYLFQSRRQKALKTLGIDSLHAQEFIE